VITHATSKVVLIDTTTSSTRELGLPYVDIDRICRVSSTSFAVVGSSKNSPQELALVSLNSSFETTREVLTSTASFELAPEFVSIATEYTAPQKYGPQPDGEVHMFYFAPRNPDFQADGDRLPPLLTYVHGGPNGAVTPALDLEIQYWTTRGFAVCAVNYTGSVGFGREYRERLSGYWGLMDVGDAVSAVEFLVTKGLVDKNRVGIYGGSAGGYLTLRALHMYPEIWAAGISNYGISDVKALQADSYKFESQDVDRLLLSKTKPEDQEAELKKRSPCYYAEQMKAPLLLLQGTDDMVVPIAQARMMADAMHSKGRVAEVVEFEGEGHGWHGQKAIFESYTREEEWWKRYLA
jgi:dipeptidyl aminopeptidase/acylaminoacyl peptidase